MSSGSHPLPFQKGTGIFLRLCWLLMRVWNFDYQNVLLESLISLNSYDVTVTAALRPSPSLSLDGTRSPHYRLSATITAIVGLQIVLAGNSMMNTTQKCRLAISDANISSHHSERMEGL
ncbi:predicted protein [Histoplasma capsulatum var. duboisii H88]|uniref:Predicted protein n=1 Tax=Ajellomyces capsulatus (strain H88) TaxID=544711 RepID=F0USF9_AJEC8|nr:predicted protein [Histoplasma capsulatum var. duboisii H88]